jgi:hypothetical protein
MNPLKQKYGFVDLLKPENEGVLPLLAVLEPGSITQIGEVWKLRKRMKKARFGADGRPLDPANIGVGPRDPEQSLFDLARELAGDTGAIGARGPLQQRTREMMLRGLYRAFRAMAERHARALHINEESPTYGDPAEALAGRGFKLVIFGHTHLAKRVPLRNGGLYLNTGTWADLIRLPAAVLGNDEAAAMAELTLLADDLERNDLGARRKQLPTFAQVELGEGGAMAGELFLFHRHPDRAERLPDGSLWEVWDRYA